MKLGQTKQNKKAKNDVSVGTGERSKAGRNWKGFNT